MVRDHARALGIGENAVRDVLGRLNALYKEQALLSTSYPINNVLSALLMGGLEGVSPLRVGRSIVTGLPEMFRGLYQGPEHIQNLETTLGIRVPAGATSPRADQ